MGNCMSCIKDNRNVEGEFKAAQDIKDLDSVITLQSIIRGYLDRRKISEYTKLKFAKSSTWSRKRSQGVTKSK